MRYGIVMLVACLVSLQARARSAEAQDKAAVFVAVNGLDTNAGTITSPLATLQKAIELAESRPGPAEIVMRGGTYYLHQSVKVRRSEKQSRLTIRAADDETPVLDGSAPLAAAVPLKEYPGVYIVEGEYPTDDPPKIWEVKTGRFFSGQAGPESVSVTDYSSVVLDEETLAIRCKNGMPPAEADIRVSGLMYGLQILRDGVTVRGIHFQNFASMRAASAVIVGGVGMTKGNGEGKQRQGTFVADTVIDSCSARHCYLGFRVYLTGKNTTFTRCKTRNTVCGIYISGLDTRVEHCELINDPGFHTDMLTWDYRYDRCGIRFYNRPEDAVIRHNFIQGFEHAGIHSKGSPGTYVVEYNTIVGIPRSFSIDKGFRVKYNIFADNTVPFQSDLKGELEATIDYNLFWGPRDLTAVIRNEKVGGKPHNIFGAPHFASPDQGDYRLLPDSPAIGIQGNKNAGACPRVPDDYRGPPNLQVALVRRRGDSVEAKLSVTGMARAEAMRYAINDDALVERLFASANTFILPDPDKEHTLRVQVRDANGIWSAVNTVSIPVPAQNPKLVGAPSIIANRYGALFAFEADQAARGEVEYHDDNTWVAAGRCTYANGRRTPLLVTGLPPGRPHRYRINVHGVVAEGEFNLAGAPRIMYVASGGEDAEAGGSREKPFATIQYALERALPGDRVRILPGIYFGAYQLENRGGTDQPPLIIEGLYPNTVVLDGLRQENTLLRVNKTPHVVLRNLNFRWYVDSAVTFSDSPGARVTGCRFINNYWRGGAGPTCRSLNFFRSPHFTVDRCIFARTRYGLSVESSPGGRIVHNTAVANSVTHVLWRGAPSDDIVIQYNSFNWNGNSLLYLPQPQDTIQKRSTIDCNNYGTTFMREKGAQNASGRYGRSLAKPFPYLPSNREFIAGNKTFVNMEDWLVYSGQDKNSIFADPKLIDPRAGRFDVAADSPNLLPDGMVIGALGYLGENPNVAPEVVVTAPCTGEEIGGAVAIAADASDFDGAITKVEFYDGDRLIGQASPAPYRISPVKLAPGRHVITARAIDNRDRMTVSDSVELTIR